MTKDEKLQTIVISDRNFSIQNNAYCFLPGDRMPKHTAGEGFLGKLQDQIKRYGNVYYFLLTVFRPVLRSSIYRKTIRRCFDKYSQDHIIVNLGSGPRYFNGRTDIINIDVFAFDEVDIVADACKLPIMDKSVDFILNVAMLEHVDNPDRVVQEMYRILKPSGEALVFTPFMQPYHAAPHDYYRWNHQGLKKLFSSFNETDIFIGCGPTSGMLWIVEEWLATLLSFGSKTLHDIGFIMLMMLLFPIKYCDLILNRFPSAESLASGFGILAMKKV